MSTKSKLAQISSKLPKIETEKDELKRDLLLFKEKKKQPSMPQANTIIQEQDAFRDKLISKLEKGIANLNSQQRS